MVVQCFCCCLMCAWRNANTRLWCAGDSTQKNMHILKCAIWLGYRIVFEHTDSYRDVGCLTRQDPRRLSDDLAPDVIYERLYSMWSRTMCAVMSFCLGCFQFAFEWFMQLRHIEKTRMICNGRGLSPLHFKVYWTILRRSWPSSSSQGVFAPFHVQFLQKIYSFHTPWLVITKPI